MSSLRHALAWGLSLLLSGCVDGADAVDLPPGWADAEPIADFVQSKCSGSAYDGPEETVTALLDGDALRVQYTHAHFRCEQAVQGFVRRRAGALDILVQPVELDPSMVTKCDCLYDLAMVLDPMPGDRELTVYRRWDNLNDDNEPVKVARAAIEQSVCEPGADQSCNDDPAISSLHGACTADGRCECARGFAKSPATGRCL